MVAAKMANLNNGQRTATSANLQSSPITQPQAAKLMNVSPRQVAALSVTRNKPTTKLQQAVWRRPLVWPDIFQG